MSVGRKGLRNVLILDLKSERKLSADFSELSRNNASMRPQFIPSYFICVGYAFVSTRLNCESSIPKILDSRVEPTDEEVATFTMTAITTTDEATEAVTDEVETDKAETEVTEVKTNQRLSTWSLWPRLFQPLAESKLAQRHRAFYKST